MEKPSLSEVHILLVEDDRTNQVLIRQQLELLGARVTLAYNGKEALEKADATVNVVLMDYQMPIMDGFEATKLLRAQGFTRPIIALTAHAMKGDREECLQAGMDNYISKPVLLRELCTMLQGYI